jgi:hypothetical protein
MFHILDRGPRDCNSASNAEPRVPKHLRLLRFVPTSCVDIETQTLGVKIQLVLSAVLLQNLGNLSRVFDLTELDVALALLDCVADKLSRAGLTLRTDNEGLLLLAGLVNEERSALGLLLSDLLGFDGGGEFGGEGQVLECRNETDQLYKH